MHLYGIKGAPWSGDWRGGRDQGAAPLTPAPRGVIPARRLRDAAGGAAPRPRPRSPLRRAWWPPERRPPPGRDPSGPATLARAGDRTGEPCSAPRLERAGERPPFSSPGPERP